MVDVPSPVFAAVTPTHFRPVASRLRQTVSISSESASGARSSAMSELTRYLLGPILKADYRQIILLGRTKTWSLLPSGPPAR